MTGLDQRFALYCGSLVYILAQLLSVFRVHKYGYVLPLVVYEWTKKKVHLCVNIVIIFDDFFILLNMIASVPSPQGLANMKKT